MLCVEDALDSLRWAESVGGLPGLIARCEASLATIAAWVARSDWIDFLAEAPDTRSCTSVCLKLTAPWVVALPVEAQWAVAKRIAALLETEGVAYDIAAHRDSPPGLRIWTGATIETANVAALLPWLDWAYATAAAEQAPARAAE